MKIRIVAYTDKYKSAVEKSLSDLSSYLAQFNPYRRKTPDPTFGSFILKSLQKQISQRGGAIFLALDEDIVAGCVTGLIRQPDAEKLLEYIPYKRGYVSDLYVSPEYRKQNIGYKLLQKMETFFKSEGCSGLQINVRINNIPAYKLYQKAGFIDDNVNLVKSI